VNRLEAALLDIAGHLQSQNVPYMVIGGFANLHWGRPRLTEDLDVKIDVEEARWAEFTDGLRVGFEILVPNALEFLGETRVLPVQTRTGVRVDLVMAELPYEREAIRRAVTVAVGSRSVHLTTAEDLILHKIISDRNRDRDDVEGVIALRGGELDRDYLDPRVRELACGLEKPEILEFYEECIRKAGAGG
jgi:hypothetical protein